MRSTVLVLALLFSVPAAAQDIGQIIEAGNSHLAAYRYGVAFEHYQQIPETATPQQLLDKHVGLAMSMMGVSRYTDVMPHITRARALAEQIGTDSAMARAENIQGQYESGTKVGDRGVATFERAAARAARAGAQSALASIYSNLGNSYAELEDFERQTYYTQKAFELIPEPTPGQQFNYRMSRGIALFEMYDRNAAEVELEAALELSAVTKRPRDRAFSLGELAYLYWTFDRDAGRSLRLYQEAIDFARIAKVASMEANWTTNRGNIYRDTGDYARAEADYRESIRILDANGASRQTFHMWKNIGQTMRLRGETADAAALLARLLAERSGDAGPRHLWQANMELASAYATLGDRDRAETHFLKMLDHLEEQRKTPILDSFRSGSFAHALSAYDPYERYIRFLLAQGDARAVDALGVAERARARGFLEALASVRGAVAAKLPAALLAEESRITRAISTAQDRLRSPALDKARRDAALAELSRAEVARENFLLAMRVEHPAIAEARYPAFLPAAEIQQALRPGETAFAFFLAEPSSIRWTITRDRISVAHLPARAAIERQAGRLRELLSAPSDLAATRGAAAALSSQLFDDAGLRGDGPIAIVPHGVLHYIPFEVLPAGDGLLIERHAVGYAPSLNALVQLRRAPANTAPFRVLAVGNPPAASANRAATRAGELDNLALLAPLPFAEQELHAIGRTFPDRTRILSGGSARESGLRTAGLPQYPVLHFATHGLVSDAQPKRSGLLLAPEAGEDGLLQMGEIYGLGLKADLVVLSACQTALGKEITGEGLIGLSRAFFYAGARSVLATLWNLNDRFAAEFVQRFYREVNEGRSSEEALRRAKLAYINHPRYAHPFYWASLVLHGDGTRVLVEEPVRAPITLSVLAAAFAIAAIGIALASRRG
jgi:CHAT domain-containing protein